jgi:RNA polymerase sigma factor (sigma-70 family)
LDPALIRRAQAGDVDAFTALVAGRIEPMQRTAMAILGREADAKDAVAQALESVWRDLPRLRDAAAFDAWSTRILVHACRKLLRRRAATSIRELTLADSTDTDPRTPASPSAETVLARIALERAFERLGPDERTILVLHHLDGHGLAAIASILGVPIGTAKSRLFAARRALERALERER